ncbi:MAG TPA: ABC transporter ATP-binding protein [Sphaerochaeta sp.]|jgi:iron complex transport system ATP-binding protein|nr:ABC transporter ATP-binding protein [Spirochaetota bacterium]NLV60818.1 ABC transporter ATP-binding protein [Spirochaetales bacterium]HOE83802.1 ABC transporter ATP-binding protein [Sphaerochaeta sp.]HOQ94269.1 ABC transporter ATP-binding protein [Sphaerochaeta sp.]HPK46705.1 ABC transporter ATP-binding protein [Sphaerochaeta sp.]
MDSLTFKDVNGGWGEPLLFENLSLSVPRGSFTALTGPNGSGKSTLLKLIYKEIRPTEGAIYLNGGNIASMTQKELARKIGFVAQHHLHEYAFTAREVVAMGRYAHPRGEDDAVIDAAMEACDITHLADTLITTLSGGEQQRVILARALAQQGRLLLLDEPVNHLDVKHQQAIMELLRRLSHQGYTIICVLHDLLLAQIYSDRTIMLKDGVIVAHDRSDAVFTKERLAEVYQIEAHQVFDPVLGRSIWLASHRGA